MTKANIALVLAVAAIVIAGIAVLGHGSKSLFGSTSCANITCLSGGLRLVSDAGGDFESDVAAVFNSTVNIVGSFTAATTTFSGGITAQKLTLTETVGCIQLNATSTATNDKLVLSTLGATSTFAGTVYFNYGTCP